MSKILELSTGKHSLLTTLFSYMFFFFYLWLKLHESIFLYKKQDSFTCKVKCVARTTLNPQTVKHTAVPLSSAECFSIFQLIVLILRPTFLVRSLNNRQLFSLKTLKKPTIHYLPSTKRQTDS